MDAKTKMDELNLDTFWNVWPGSWSLLKKLRKRLIDCFGFTSFARSRCVRRSTFAWRSAKGPRLKPWTLRVYPRSAFV